MNKYRNKKVMTDDGEVFDSKREAELACFYNLKSIGFDTDKLGKALSVEYTINGRKT